ncbi:MAG: hydrogenase formation protein HypD [Phycisphaerales bacterium]|nr:hydrogenase formation protein HypD [Phycisphaerales bacterium]
MTAAETVRSHLARIERAAISMRQKALRGCVVADLTFMEICGTHTTTAFRTGLHSLLPTHIKLLSGPGCPVCVTAQPDIDQLINLAKTPNLTICTYGDLLRLPGNGGSLENARSKGADIQIIYSPLDALALAKKQPQREFIFAAVGFETTAPATAAAILEAQALNLKNFSVLNTHKRVIPALSALLASNDLQLDGLICPGHVAAIIGCKPFRSLAKTHKIPCVITGFEQTHMSHALAILAELTANQSHQLSNAYPEAVPETGNPTALALIDEVFQPSTTNCRALGPIPHSGLQIRTHLATYDATKKLNLPTLPDRSIPGCLCHKVILATATPPDCTLFAKACTPIHPIGPCMVSSEGTCSAHFKYNRNHIDRSNPASRGVSQKEAVLA